MKHTLFIITFLVSSFPALASHSSEILKCKEVDPITSEVGKCIGNGPILPKTTWIVYRAQTVVGGNFQEPTAIKVVTSEQEAYRLSMLELARHLLSQTTQFNWKGTFIQEWLNRYTKGER